MAALAMTPASATAISDGDAVVPSTSATPPKHCSRERTFFWPWRILEACDVVGAVAVIDDVGAVVVAVAVVVIVVSVR